MKLKKTDFYFLFFHVSCSGFVRFLVFAGIPVRRKKRSVHVSWLCWLCNFFLNKKEIVIKCVSYN